MTPRIEWPKLSRAQLLHWANMVRPSPSALFVCGAIALAAGVGIMARSAAGSEKGDNALPPDAARLGFTVVGPRVNGIAMLDATQPFRIELTHGAVHGTPARGPRLALTRAVVTRELERYPRKFLDAIHMRGIVFIDELHEGETSIPSLPNVAGLLLLDISGTESDLTRGLHHEIFHFADLADDGAMSPDAPWDALNGPGFAYGAGGRTLRAAWAAGPLDPFMSGGFVSSYATSGVEEDKAETFAFAVARPAQVLSRVAANPVLTAKLAELERRVGKMDPDAPRALGLTR
ncbi:hypothetical protein BH11MYX4_BH11MYX4_69720 [soil metagenome]